MTFSQFLTDAGALCTVLGPASLIAWKMAKFITQLTALVNSHQTLVTRVEHIAGRVESIANIVLTTAPEPAAATPIPLVNP